MGAQYTKGWAYTLARAPLRILCCLMLSPAHLEQQHVGAGDALVLNKAGEGRGRVLLRCLLVPENDALLRYVVHLVQLLKRRAEHGRGGAGGVLDLQVALHIERANLRRAALRKLRRPFAP